MTEISDTERERIHRLLEQAYFIALRPLKYPNHVTFRVVQHIEHAIDELQRIR